MAVEDGVVKYRKNGALIYTSSVPPKFPLVFDTALYQPGSTVQNVMISGTLVSVSPEPVQWTNLVNVTPSSNSITKTGGAASAWDSGAVSSRALALGDGYMEFRAVCGINVMAGLSNGDSGAAYEDIDFAMYVASASVAVYEGGTYRGSVSTCASGDVFRVAVENGVVKYRKNGVVIYTSTVVPTYPLLVDSSLSNMGTSISQVALAGNLTDLAVAAPLFSPPSGTYSSPQTVTVSGLSGAEIRYTTDGSEPTAASPMIASGGTIEVSAPYTVLKARSFASGLFPSGSTVGSYAIGSSVTEAVQWTSVYLATASGNTLTKSGSVAGFDSGGVSTKGIVSSNGYVEFRGDGTHYAMSGLNSTEYGVEFWDIDYAIYLRGDGLVAIYENGTELSGVTTTYVASDVFRVAVEDGVVKYRKNGALIHTSSVSPKFPLVFDTALYQPGSTVQNVMISGTLVSVSPEPVQWTNLVNVTPSSNSITKTGGTPSAWDSGAVSTRAIAWGDGYMEFQRACTTSFAMAGLSNSDGGAFYTDIDFALDVVNGAVHVYEGGNHRGQVATCGPGDVFRVSVESGLVKYRKNGQLLYTSTLAPTFPLLVDTSIWANGISIDQVVISGNLLDIATAAPQFSPPPGIFANTQTIALSSGSPGAAIYYTTNGATPTTASAQYATPLSLTGTTTVKAIAVRPGFFPSTVSTGQFSFQAAVPVLSPGGGPAYGPVEVSMTSATEAAVIRYTVGGAEPSEASAAYTAPITIEAGGVVKARAFKAGFEASPVATATYLATLAPPVIAPTAGPISGPIQVTISALPATPGWAAPTVCSAWFSNIASGWRSKNWVAADCTNGLPLPGSSVVAQGRTGNGTAGNAMCSVSTGSHYQHPSFGETQAEVRCLYVPPATPTATVCRYYWPEAVTGWRYRTWQASDCSNGLPPAGWASIADAQNGNGTAGQVSCSDTQGGHFNHGTIAGATSGQVTCGYFQPTGGDVNVCSHVFSTNETGWRSTNWLASECSMGVPTAAAINGVGQASNGAGSGGEAMCSPATGWHYNHPTIHGATIGIVACALVQPGSLGNTVIRFTVDGTEPTASSPIYSGPFTVSPGTTVQAKAFRIGWLTSDTAESVYSIMSALAPPVFQPTAGAIPLPGSVTLSAAPDATIRYTADGSEPTSSSIVYTGPIGVTAPLTIKARAFQVGYLDSPVATSSYTEAPLSAPLIAPAGGTFGAAQTVTLSATSPGSEIRYTTDGGAPTVGSSLYSGPMTVAATTTINAATFKDGMAPSAVSSESFIISGPAPNPPVITPGTGEYSGDFYTVSIASEPGTSVWYTTDGSTPTAGPTNPASLLYTTSFQMGQSATVRALTENPAGLASDPASATVTLASGGDSDRTPKLAEAGAPAGSYALNGFETVNLYNGNLSFRLPLLNIRGRGEAGFGMGLAISRTFQMRQLRAVKLNPGGPSDPPDEPRFYWPQFNRWQIASGYGPGAMIGRRVLGDGTRDVLLSFVEADGTEHELRGASHNTGPAQPGQCQSDHHALAGSAATFNSDSTICSDGVSEFGPTGNLHLRDGRLYRIEGGLVAWMRDRNGNTLSFEYNAPAEQVEGLFKLNRVTRIVDSLGRTVNITYSLLSSGYDVISFTGAGAAPRTIRVERTPLVEAMIGDSETVPDPLPEDPNHRRARTIAELFPMPTGFEWVALQAALQHNPTVAKSVEIPDGRRYQFRYNRYGELVRAELPTGGVIEYERGAGTPALHESGAGDGYIYRRVTLRRTLTEAGAIASETQFGLDETGPFGTSITVRHHDAAAGELSVGRHDFIDSVRIAGGQLSGKERKTSTYSGGADPATATPLSIVENAWELQEALPYEKNPRLTSVVTTLGSSTTRKEFEYSADGFNNRTANLEFDSAGNGTLLRKTTTSFVTDALYTDAPVHLRGLPLSESIFSGANLNAPVAETRWEYDTAPLDGRPNAIGVDRGVSLRRGNQTVTRRMNFTTAEESVTSTRYDELGNAVRDTDPRNNTTHYSYADRFGVGDGEVADGVVDCQFCSGVSAVSNALGQTATFEYDFNLGAVTDSADANGVISTVRYGADPLDRPTAIETAAGTSAGAKTRLEYEDPERLVKKFADRDAFGDGLLKAESQFDGLGRPTKTWTSEGVGWIETRTTYDGLGRVHGVSNPFRELPDGWTYTTYDALGRVTTVVAPDGADTVTSYNGFETTVTDPAGKKRTTVTDALGRIQKVIEDPGGVLHAETLYEYDALDNLTKVTQGGQIRTFVYDSLSRLRSASNPESGTTTYDYDDAGNLLKKTDARGVETHFTYDSLNRPKTKTYVGDTAETPTVTYGYDDPSVPYAAGRLTSSLSNLPTTSSPETLLSHTFIDAYDPAGRVRNHRQVTRGLTYPTTYSYNRAGATTSMSYPSGRVIDYEYDAAGRLASVSGTNPAGGPEAFVSAVSYAPHGAVESWTLGNGVVESTGFNERLQPVGLSVDAESQLLGINYGYHAGSPTTNNGNVLAQEVFIGGVSRFQMGYTYDPLNRLKTATEPGGWSETYGYDRFGNRSVVPGDSSSYSTANNRIANWDHYDLAGNLQMLPDGQGIEYDAENRQIEFAAGVAAPFQYRYDSEGRRVTKDVEGGLETTFVYSSSGQLLAEYSSDDPGLREHIYAGSKLIAVASGGAGAPPPSPTAPHPIGPFGVEDNCDPDTLFTFRWNALPGAVEYELEVDNVVVGRFSGGAVCDSNGYCSAEPEANQSVQPFAPYVDHHWRVRAILPGTSAWSGLLYYRLGPGPATPLSPSGVWPRIPTVFEWRPWASGTQYTLLIDGNVYGTFGADVCGESKCRVTLSTTPELAPGPHQWRIDGDFPQCSLLSAPLTFTYDPSLVCTDFEQKSPGAGSPQVAPFYFTWRDPLYVDEGSGPATPEPRTFILKITEDVSGSMVQSCSSPTSEGCEVEASCLRGRCSVSTTTMGWSAPAPGAYRWSLKEFSGEQCEEIKFQVVTGLLGNPTLLAPIGFQTDSALTFRWEAVPGAASYTVFVENATPRVQSVEAFDVCTAGVCEIGLQVDPSGCDWEWGPTCKWNVVPVDLAGRTSQTVADYWYAASPPTSPTCEEFSGTCTSLAVSCEADAFSIGRTSCASGDRCCVPRCESNLDCAAAGQVCNASTGSCSTPAPTCSSNSQCSTGQVCQSGACGACSADSQCDSGNMCDAAGACVPWQCADSSQCAVNQTCEAHRCLNVTCEAGGGVCTPIEAGCEPGDHLSPPQLNTCGSGNKCCLPGCESDTDCTGGKACNTSTGLCYTPTPSCSVNSECSPGQVCQSGSCGVCSADSQCDSGSMCDAAGACVPWQCADSSQCAANQTCEAHRCLNVTCEQGGGTCTPLVDGCEPGSHIEQQLNTCGSGNRCCVPGCQTNTDCTGGQVCNGLGVCVQCTENAHCPAGNICSGNSCIPAPPTCGDQACNGDENVNTCEADCKGDGVCAPNVESCGNSPSDCPCPGGTYCSATPYPGVCVQCTQNAHCPAGNICSGNSCISAPPACGDQSCNGDENINTCEVDCKGDGVCAPNVESCGNSPNDCPCPGGQVCSNDPWPGVCVDPPPAGSVCGNNSCEAGESCTSCAADCGECPGLSCGAAGGDYCSQSGSCPEGATNLGTTYDCSPCCLVGESFALVAEAACGVTMSCMGGSPAEATADSPEAPPPAADDEVLVSHYAPAEGAGAEARQAANAPRSPAETPRDIGASHALAALPRRFFVLEAELVAA